MVMATTIWHADEVTWHSPPGTAVDAVEDTGLGSAAGEASTGVSGSGTTWDGGAGVDAVISVPASSPSGSGRASPSSTT